MWAPASVLGPGMLGLLVALTILIAWSLLLSVAIYAGGFGDRRAARSAAAEWWRLRRQHGWLLVMLEIGAVLVLFGLFTWLAGRQPTLGQYWKHFLWETLMRNPHYRLQEYTYAEMCGWFSRPTLWSGAVLISAAAAIWSWRRVYGRRQHSAAAAV